MLYSSHERSSKQKMLMIIAGAVMLLLAIAAGFFFWQYTQLKNNPNAEAEATTKRLVAEVSKIYAVPTDEQPTVAEVKDKEKLKDQQFFKNAENGDYILIYTNSKLALLYREKDRKLINVGPIALSDAAEGTGNVSPTKVNVKVINGSNKNGQAAALGEQLAGKLSSLVTVDTNYTDAKKKNVTKTIVVDVNGNKADAAKQIADAIGGEVGSLPAGEDKPSSDILVIAGN